MTHTGPPNHADVTSLGRVLNDHLKKRPHELKDYTLDYGYEGDGSGSDYGEMEAEAPDVTDDGLFDDEPGGGGSSGFHENLNSQSPETSTSQQPFGDAFEALDDMPESHDI